MLVSPESKHYPLKSFGSLIKYSLKKIFSYLSFAGYKTWKKEMNTTFTGTQHDFPFMFQQAWAQAATVLESSHLRTTCKLPTSWSLHTSDHSYWRQAPVIKRWRRNNKVADNSQISTKPDWSHIEQKLKRTSEHKMRSKPVQELDAVYDDRSWKGKCFETTILHN